MRILIADDERDISDALGTIFTYHGYECDVVYDGANALSMAKSKVYDAILLDIMMPGLDGIAVLERIREDGDFTPVVMLTAKGETTDKIQGLNDGADDYVTKPFVSSELVARVDAAIRRREAYSGSLLTFENIAFDEKECRLYNRSSSLRVTGKEARLIAFFMRNAEKPISEAMLLERFWNGEDPKSGAVALYIGYIRNKFSSVSENADIRLDGNGHYYLTKRGG